MNINDWKCAVREGDRCRCIDEQNISHLVKCSIWILQKKSRRFDFINVFIWHRRFEGKTVMENQISFSISIIRMVAFDLLFSLI